MENQNQEIDVSDEIENLDYKEEYPNKKDFKAKVWYLSWNCSKGASKGAIEEIYKKNAKSIKKLAYCLHNKDLQKDGLPKEHHYHVVFVCKYACRVSTVHNWFNLPLGMVRVASKKNTFNNLIVYFTHQKFQNNIEKQHYSISDITVLGEEVDVASIVDNALNNTPLNKKELKRALKESLLRNEISISDIQEKHPDIYVDDVKKFDEIDRKRVDLLPLPKERINFYITGKGGVGKDFLSDLLSYHLTSDEKELDVKSAKERVFTCGSPKVALQAYAGQECIIYRDYRAGNLLDCFAGRGGVFNAFDTIPKDASNNIKYGEVTLKNKYSIVNSVQSFVNFTNALCEISDREIKEYAFNEELANQKRYENKTQVLRRFAFIIVIVEDRILLAINKNFLHPNDSIEEYTEDIVTTINLRHAIEIIKKASDKSQERVFNNARKVLKKFLDVIDNALKTHIENREYKEESQSDLEELINSVECSIQWNNGMLPPEYFDKIYKLTKELFRKEEHMPMPIINDAPIRKEEHMPMPIINDAPKREDIFRKDLINEDNKRDDKRG